MRRMPTNLGSALAMTLAMVLGGAGCRERKPHREDHRSGTGPDSGSSLSAEVAATGAAEASGQTVAAPGTDAGFQTLLKGDGSPSRNSNQGPELHWFRSDSAWSKSLFSAWLAGAITSGQASHGGVPSGRPEFATHDVLVFTLGDVGNSGHSITLLKIDRNGKAVFHLKSTKPGKLVTTAQMMRNPFHMVRVDKGLPSTDPEFLLDGKPTAFTIHIQD